MIEKENCTTCYLAANRTEEQSKIFQASFSLMREDELNVEYLFLQNYFNLSSSCHGTIHTFILYNLLLSNCFNA